MEIIIQLKKILEEISDPRVQGRSTYDLSEVLIVTFIAILCGCENWIEIVDFGNSKLDWFLKNNLKLINGIPSHDTFGRIFSIIRPDQLENIFIKWVNNIRSSKGYSIIAVDGKTIKGTVKNHLGHCKSRLHIVNAYSLFDDLVLGLTASKGSGDEGHVAKELLGKFDLKNSVVLADAGIGKAGFLNEITEAGGDYFVPVKSNSRPIFSRIQSYFDINPESRKTTEIMNKSNGRVEIRSIILENSKKVINEINFNERSKLNVFPNVKTIAKIITQKEMKENRPFYADSSGDGSINYRLTDKTTRTDFEVRYFASSLELNANQIEDYSRKLWWIENKLHWILDVSFREDAWRTRDQNAARNLSVIRRMGLNLVKRDKETKLSMKSRLKKASYDLDYLEKILFEF